MGETKKKILIYYPEEDRYLSALRIYLFGFDRSCSFTALPLFAFPFENFDTARATIAFISDVIDFELGEQLEIIEYPVL